MTTEPISTFSKWAKGFSGCDGGDIGNSNARAIWICGIEWGIGEDANVMTLAKLFEDDVSVPDLGHQDWKNNLAHRYNLQAMKLLAAIDGRNVGEYKQFAKEIKPFTLGTKGYFKMNLYPFAFRNTSHVHWTPAFSEATGFQGKGEYLKWMKLNRFPVIRTLATKHSPKLIICTGITYQEDFRLAFGEASMNLTIDSIDNRKLSHGFNRQGTLVVVIPFPSGPSGLTKNTTIQKIGDRIRTLLSNGSAYAPRSQLAAVKARAEDVAHSSDSPAFAAELAKEGHPNARSDLGKMVVVRRAFLDLSESEIRVAFKATGGGKAGMWNLKKALAFVTRGRGRSY